MSTLIIQGTKPLTSKQLPLSPPGSVVVFEDIDVAMLTSGKVLRRENNMPDSPMEDSGNKKKESSGKEDDGRGARNRSSITLSGL